MTKILAALLNAKKSFKVIHKNRTGKILTKSGASYSYKYADLPDVLAAVESALIENNIWWDQNSARTEDGAEVLVTNLVHESGETRSSTVRLIEPIQAGPQGYGSTLTYSRRYGLCNALGICAEEDTDGHVAQNQKDDRGTDMKPPPNNPPVNQQRPPTQQRPPANKTQNAPPQAPREGYGPVLVTPAQIKRLMAIGYENGWPPNETDKFIALKYGHQSKNDLRRDEYDAVINHIMKNPLVKDDPNDVPF